MDFDFYGDVLPADGHFALWTKANKRHHWVASHDELRRGAEEMAAGGGLYFATAAFSQQAADNGQKDARTQANVTAKKAFYLDLDAGEKKYAKHGDKAYPTQRDALGAVIAFAKANGLPPTYIVSSGEGLHVYWCLTEAIDGDTWTALARKFARLCAEQGLRQDSSCTTDSARVLRAPGAPHENGKIVQVLGKRGRTYSMGDWLAALSNVSESDDLPPPPPRLDKRTGINADVIVEGPPKSIKKIVPQCGALADVVRLRGNVEEPYWRAMLGIVKHTVEGDTAAHAFSSGHPEYSKRDTQFKLDNWKAGPSTCAEFAKYSDKCKGCRHNGKIKSPITLGYMTSEQVQELPEEQKPIAERTTPAPATGHPWDGFIPPKFAYEKHDGVDTIMWHMKVEKENDEGDKEVKYLRVPVTADVFWFTQWSDAEHTDDTAQVFVNKWSPTQKRVTTYTVDQTLLANQQKLREFLASKSIITNANPKSPRAMEEYTKAQVMMVKAIREMPKIGKRFGLFVTDDGHLACAQGEYVIDHTGVIRKAILAPELRALAPQLAIPLPTGAAVRWEPDVWDETILPRAKRHVEFLRKHYNRPGLEKFQLACMMMLASPFMAFVTGEYVRGRELPPTGLSVSLYSAEGGRGKTTLMKASALAYGRPAGITTDKNSAGATALARIARMSLMGTLPVGMDEMGDMNAAACASLISAVANGSGRERATKDGGLSLGSTWALMCLIAANKSQRDMIAAANGESNAIQFRLLELDVDNVAEFGVGEREVFDKEWASIADCAGALGAVIHRKMCELGVSAINRLVVGAVAKASARIESKQTDRFQYRGLGAVMALHALLRSIGLEIFDLETMVAEFRRAHESGHSYAVENTMPTDGLELLNAALHELTPYTAITNDETRRTRHQTNFDEPVVAMPKEVHARHVISKRRTYVSSTALREWTARNKVSFSKMMHAAKEDRVMVAVYESKGVGPGSYNLLKGMRGSTESMVSCYCFDIGRLRLLTGKDPLDGALEQDGSNVVQMVRAAPAQQEPETAEESGT